MIKKLKNAKEKGAIIVFTALLLPLMMICVGLAFDLGNLYVHKTRLQNAADAAALAGAREFAASNDTRSPDTVSSHPAADAEAREYAEENAEKNNIKNEISLTPAPQAKEDADNNAIYYRVDLQETVPLYFLRIIGREQQDVSASAIAAIAWSVAEENTSGDELFIVKSHFDAVNAVNNPDTVTMAGQVSTTFDGNIVVTDGTLNAKSDEDGKAYLKNMEDNDHFKYSSQMAGLNAFLKSEASKNNMTIEDAVIKDTDMKYHSEAYYEPYDETALPAKARAAMGLPDPIGNVPTWQSSQAEWDAYGVARDNYRSSDGYDKFLDINAGNKTVDASMLTENCAYTTTGDGNLAINLNSSISGTEPVYLYIDETVNQHINLDVTASNGRPVIFIYNGTAEVAFNISSGQTFSGYVYAPYASQVIVNAGGASFEGTIMADNLTLRGDNASYKYVNYGMGGGSGQGSKVRILTKTSSIKLANPSNISWD
ncbi:MAG: Tad domain-containing protein [Selenomonadaceae bacterium]|nr:Tad domain-containing protein [Selenomonadaceae bacterium]MBP3722780.1 Tad domain-containing protein [Selenomonadaceae bacterium]